MALLFIDGFDDDLQAGKWNIWGTTVGVTNARSGDAMLINENIFQSASKTIGGTEATIVVGGFMTYTGIQTVGGIQFMEGTTTHVNIRHNGPTNELNAYRGTGSLLAQSGPGTAPLNQSAFVEFKVFSHDSTGTVEIRWNGDVIMSLTSQDTRSAGTPLIDTIGFGSNSGSPWYIDDLYIADTTGSVANDFLGDSKVVTRFPDSDSTPLQWVRSAEASNFLTVDESPPDEVAWNASSSTGEIDMYGFPNLTDGNDIWGVQVGGSAFKDATGVRFYQLRAISDASTEKGPSVGLSTSGQGTAYMVDLDPDGSVQWTQAQLNAAFFGVEVSTG